MDALATDIQEGPLDVDAQHAGHARRDGGLHGVDGPVDHVQVVADQGGQKAGRAEPAVRRGDGGDALGAGVVVEQHPAAAVDLGVDVAGRQQAAAQVVILARGRAIRRHGDDSTLVDDDAESVAHAAGRRHPAVDQVHGHQTVSVTLLR